MEIPTNMHMLTFLAACVLFTTTECATSFQDCPGGSVDVDQDTTDVLTCEGYSAAQITWEFMPGQSTFLTIGHCTSSSTCSVVSTYQTAFSLTAITGTSSELNITTTFTAGVKTATFACDGVECIVNIVEPTTTAMTTTTVTEARGKEELTGGQIAGIVIGVIIVIVIGVIIVVILWCKKEKKCCFETNGNGTGNATPLNCICICIVRDKPANSNGTGSETTGNGTGNTTSSNTSPPDKPADPNATPVVPPDGETTGNGTGNTTSSNASASEKPAIATDGQP